MVQRSTTERKRRRRKDRSLAGLSLLSLSILGAAFILSRDRSVEVRAAEPQTTIVGEFDTVALPVPANFVPTGTKMRDIALRHVAFPRHQVPKNALTSLSGFENSVTIAPLPANLPIFPENMSALAGRSNPVIERIPAGMRAMTVNVDATSAVEGWANSGAIIDVLLVQNDQTRVIAEKVKIISAERKLETEQSDGVIPRTVTLLVTQAQCLAINTAIPLGKIAFALRGASDDGDWASTSYTPNELKGGPQVVRQGGNITGYIAVEEGEDKRAFALSQGRWVRTEVVPEGFLVGE